MPESAAPPVTCGWRCGDPEPDHKHFAVLVRERSGKLLGRLCPDGTTAHNKIYAAVVSKAKADKVSADINAAGEYTAKTIPF